MLGTATNTNLDESTATERHLRLLPHDLGAGMVERDVCDPLEAALQLIDTQRPFEADQLLTAILVGAPSRHDLWLAAGIARFRRGAVRSAAAALRMAAWIGDDPLARELLAELEGQKHSQVSRSQAPPTS